MHISYVFIGLFILCVARGQSVVKITYGFHDLTIILGETKTLPVLINGSVEQSVRLQLWAQHEDLIRLDPNYIELTPADDRNERIITIYSDSPGSTEVTTNVTPPIINTDDLFLRITIARSDTIIIISAIVGWIYFAAWSVSFYPQIYINFKRKSVIGLNFDFVVLNLMGFTLYSVFNAGLYWSSTMENEYFRRFPRGLNPVLINDIVFSLHAMFATLVTIGQCVKYESGDQRVSTTARTILGIFVAVLIISAILVFAGIWHWLDFLYNCSYVKLTITLIKYVPQAYMNYKRKSTVGWSIGNILLDFTGGMLSMLQMLLNGYNFDDWHSLFGDPTKFGLGLFSVLFDILFILQHYVFYRSPEYENIDEDVTEDDVVT